MHGMLNELDTMKHLKTCYKILNLVLLVFIDLSLELLYCFVDF